MKRTSLSIFLLFLLTSTIYAQKSLPFSVNKTATGMSLTYLRGKTPFYFEVKGTVVKLIQSRDDGVLLKVDEKLLNILISKVSVVTKQTKPGNEESLLKAHQKWELDFQSSFFFQKPLSIDEEETVFINLSKKEKQRTLFWSFKCPPTKGSNETLRALQVTKIGDTFLALGSPLIATDSLPDRRKFFDEIFSSLLLPAK